MILAIDTGYTSMTVICSVTKFFFKKKKKDFLDRYFAVMQSE